MLEILMLGVYLWLFIKVIGLLFRVAWGTAKVVAGLLFAVALPLLVICLVFAGGLLLLVPLGMMAVAFGLLKSIT